MNHKAILLASSAAALALGAILVPAISAGDRRPATPSAEPARRDAPVRAIVSAQPFVLERPFTHVWRAEQPSYDAGWLLVLDVDPTFVEPHQTYEPVLYAGDQTVERVNHGFESGRVIAVLPSPRGADGAPSLDLASVPIYFGADELPERVTATMARSELERARRLGATPFDAAAVAAARARGGELLRLASREELDERAALLVLEQSPDEHDLATGMLAPRVR